MTGYVADLSWKSGARAIEKLDRIRSTLARFYAWIIKSAKVDYGSECVNIGLQHIGMSSTKKKWKTRLLYLGRSRVERIMDIIPRGTELELQLRRWVGQALYTCNNIHIKCKGVYWAQAEKYCYKWTVWSSVPGILDPFTNNNRPASYKAAGHRSRDLQTALGTQIVSCRIGPTHCSRDKHLAWPHINKKK